MASDVKARAPHHSSPEPQYTKHFRTQQRGLQGQGGGVHHRRPGYDRHQERGEGGSGQDYGRLVQYSLHEREVGGAVQEFGGRGTADDYGRYSHHREGLGAGGQDYEKQRRGGYGRHQQGRGCGSQDVRVHEGNQFETGRYGEQDHGGRRGEGLEHDHRRRREGVGDWHDRVRYEGARARHGGLEQEYHRERGGAVRGGHNRGGGGGHESIGLKLNHSGHGGIGYDLHHARGSVADKQSLQGHDQRERGGGHHSFVQDCHLERRGAGGWNDRGGHRSVGPVEHQRKGDGTDFGGNHLQRGRGGAVGAGRGGGGRVVPRENSRGSYQDRRQPVETSRDTCGVRGGTIVKSTVLKKKHTALANWSTLKLFNLPDKVTKIQLRRIIVDKGILGKFDIKQLVDGASAIVKFENDGQRVGEIMNHLKVGNCSIQAKVIDDDPECNRIPPLTEVCKAKQKDIPPPRRKEKEAVVPSLSAEAANPVQQADITEALGLTSLNPEYFELSEGKLNFVNCGDAKLLEDIQGNLRTILDRKMVKDILVELVNSVPEAANHNEKSIEVEEATALMPVKVVFASMDIREKVKKLEQSKQKSLGDFMTKSDPEQGQIKKKKKKKKRKSAAFEEKLADEDKKPRNSGN